ncbi:aminotransferase class I/II-fold pyridoxal phosphate-dependent enzyme [Deinococcus psychrotolerans]|uniref:Aminotransferase class I/II-fold pyridoxal phosphate-dependent enzyme n=1 Tax=Deinococcus psychrotolerans TaxID=2489213 RepID=A0A3G8YD24_9DEIO|nr:GntG family PLP-dependent aldolase [Deinococcus psychrotolerans]AZI43222.1 aminotransferase class I/II-fold pyridoxal phosphate-dependent enzyme [Deinococcus psychrotolerans]
MTFQDVQPVPTQRIDLRSDTVTVPTPEMRLAMAEAVVGDDVYGEDPTVNTLQSEVARLLGKEAALFMPSGSMTNQAAIAMHTSRGQEVICAEGSHIYEWELGMMAAFSGVVPRFVPAPLGVPDPQQVRRAVRRSIHQSPTGLISLENTHNKMGGTVIPLDVVAAIRTVADEEGLPLHLDGARMANAAAALGVSLAEVAAPFDSVSLCLSKGLGAPVGSVLAGAKADLVRAHRYRKMLGGGMRQAGILAAAGLMALRDGPARLAADHARTRKLAEALVDAGYAVNLAAVQTNIIYATIPDAQSKVERWAEQGLLASALDIDSVRFVLHYQITDEMLERAVRVLTA